MSQIFAHVRTPALRPGTGIPSVIPAAKRESVLAYCNTSVDFRDWVDGIRMGASQVQTLGYNRVGI